MTRKMQINAVLQIPDSYDRIIRRFIFPPHLSGLCGCSQTWVNSIKLANCHHAGVNLVVQLQSEYGDQHGVYCIALAGGERSHMKQAVVRKLSHFTELHTKRTYAVIHLTRGKACFCSPNVITGFTLDTQRRVLLPSNREWHAKAFQSPNLLSFCAHESWHTIKNKTFGSFANPRPCVINKICNNT